MEIGQCTGTGERASLDHFHISVCKPHSKTVKHHQQKKEGFIYLFLYFALLFYFIFFLQNQIVALFIPIIREV